MTKSRRILSLIDNFAILLERERPSYTAQIQALLESIKRLQGDTADRRLQQLSVQVKALQQHLNLLLEMGSDDFLAKLKGEAEAAEEQAFAGRALAAMMAMLENPALPLQAFCQRLLDLLIEATEAQRGFIIFYLPESTEADVMAARNYQTRNLALAEYSFSRTLFQEVLQRGESLLIEDACSHPAYGKESSVVNFQLKSVLVTPLKQGARTIGAVYLENNTRACAFDEATPQLLDVMARFAVFYLQHARLLPVAFAAKSHIFLDASKGAKEIIGQAPKILELLQVIARIADSSATVLIEGESGTGKELVARALHYQSARRNRPFVAINCAAIPHELLESELFGHEKGAFTGATEKYIGRIEQGNGGTIFLDEISELAYAMQAKLLRFLQSSEFDRLGGKETIRVDVRIIAATSKDLKALMEAGRFQEALYYRLQVIPLSLPPLRERREDMALLIAHFLEKYSAVYGKKITAEPGVYGCLQDYPFPGNVRELENLIHRLTVLACDESIRLGDLPKEILQTTAQRVSLQKDWLDEIARTPPSSLDELRQRRKAMKGMLAAQEKQLLERVIEASGGNLTEAAARLGVNRVTLHKMLRKSRAQQED